MVGPCVNNVPVRVGVSRGQSLVSWLTELQQAQFDLAQHQYAPLEHIQQWAEVPWRYRLFDSLIVFQNYQVADDARRIGADAELTLLAAPEATNYPLTVAVSMADELRVRLHHQPNAIEAQDVRQFGIDLETILHALADGPATTVDALLDLLSPELRGRASARVAETPSSETRYIAPTTETERAVSAVWCELFGVERVSLDDNFFELGGHSMLLVRAHAQLRDTLRADLPIVALLQYPTVRTLARHLTGDIDNTASATAAVDRARKQREAFARQRNLTGRRS
jgi:acyl carrier protein